MSHGLFLKNQVMKEILLISQLVISILMSILILAQNKEGGLSAAMGGGGSFQPVKRGAEKVIFRMTVLFAFLFVANAIAILFF